MMPIAISGRGAHRGTTVTGGPANPSTNATLPLFSLADMTYKGAFRVVDTAYGTSSMTFAKPQIAHHGNTMFMAGNIIDDAIAQFTIPTLVNSLNAADLNTVSAPIQNFANLIERAPGGNPYGLDEIKGMAVIDGKLVVNVEEYYDADAINSETTLILQDSDNLATGVVEGFYSIDDAAKVSGWICKIPPNWQADVGGNYMVGNSAGTSVLGRHSVGPSMGILNDTDFFAATPASPVISTASLLQYSMTNPLHTDLFNEAGDNDIWTINSRAMYGFIVPGTRTYATFGFSSGHGPLGLGYKITQDNGYVCGGPCPYDHMDWSHFHWLYDMNDLMAVKAGSVLPYDVRPYSYGPMTLPFQYWEEGNAIGGGSYDEVTNTLYFSIVNGDSTASEYGPIPIIAAYSIDTA